MTYGEKCEFVANLWREYYSNTILDIREITHFEEDCKKYGVDSIDVIILM